MGAIVALGVGNVHKRVLLHYLVLHIEQPYLLGKFRARPLSSLTVYHVVLRYLTRMLHHCASLCVLL